MRLTVLAHPLRLLLVLALAGATLVAAGTGAAEAATAACQRVFSNGVDQPIDDQTVARSTIDVPEDGLVVTDLDVVVNVQHTFPRDLEIFLRADGDLTGFRRIRQLFNHDGDPAGPDTADNLLGTVFDDEAPISIAWADAPYTGRFTPTRPLAAFDGDSGGSYQLIVDDTGTGDSGTLDDWSVVVTYASCDLDADGVEDHRDQCRGLTAKTATGCPVTTRALTAKYRSGKFRGALSSPVAGCTAGRAVTVFKVRRGADARIGTATTRADGSFRLTRSRKPGRYYATAARVAVPDRAECPAVTSATFRIH